MMHRSSCEHFCIVVFGWHLCVVNMMMQHVFIYLSCADLVACSITCNPWLDVFMNYFCWTRYCVGVGLPMPLTCYRALREYVCPFVKPVQWRTVALCRVYDGALQKYAFFQKRYSYGLLRTYVGVFEQGMCLSHIPRSGAGGAGLSPFTVGRVPDESVAAALACQRELFRCVSERNGLYTVEQKDGPSGGQHVPFRMGISGRAQCDKALMSQVA